MRHDDRSEATHPVSRGRYAGEWLAWSAILAVAAVLCASIVWSERRYLLLAEEQRMAGQSAIISQNLVRQLGAVRSVLEHARTALAVPRQECDDACRRAAVQGLRGAMPGVHALTLVDRGGRVLFSDVHRGEGLAAALPVPAPDSAHTLYLSAAAAPTASGIVATAAMAAGDAVLVASLDADYFDAVMRSSLYAPDMNSAVTNDAGTRLFFIPYSDRAPQPPTPGHTPFYLRHLRSGQAGTIMRGALTPGGERRLIAQRSVDAQTLLLDRALVVGVSRSMDAVDAPWRRLLWEYGLAWAGIALLGSAALLRSQRQRRWSERIEAARTAERAVAAERIELALGGADLGLWHWQVAESRFETDARGLAMLGYTPAEAGDQDRDWLRQVHPDDRRALEQALLAPGIGEGAFDVEYRLRHRCGYWVWTLSRGKVLERDAAGVPVRLVGTRMDISLRKQSEAEIAHLAFHDGLTSLPNRRLLLDRLAQALAKAERNKLHGALLFLDLDNFKTLNDTLGHHMGDSLLQRVAMRLQDATRDSDTVARLGGDEFVVLLENLGATAIEARAHAELVAAKIVHALGQPHRIEGHDIVCTPSVGVAMFDPHTRTVDKLLKQGDMAMYEAKAAGRNGYRVFDPAVQSGAEDALRLEAELRQALANHQFALFYQPIMDRHGAMTGVEALLRWRHPERGLVGPADFICQAEKSDLIVDIGNWVLEAACQQLRAWSRAPHTEHLTIAVNISARQAHQRGFVETVQDIVTRTGARPARLKLELTESLLLGNVDEMKARMGALKTFGVGFALDDFGTGYSSLSYLEKLPIAQLKIDRSFINEMLATDAAATIVRAVIMLAANLGLEVVAEGVETEAQRQRLLEYGCERFQGYLFTPPVPLERLGDWLPRPRQPARITLA